MQEALLYLATTLSLAAMILLIVRPHWGLIAIFIVRPLVDATWAQTLVFDFKLTELVSSFVPLIIFARAVFLDDGRDRLFRDMPLRWDWLICSVDAVFFSALIMFQQDWRIGLSVLMRHLNGMTGFYMVQAYCRNEREFLRLAWALAIAGIFPMATGVWEGVTGQHWSVTIGTDDVVRNIGMYHDAITIRCYGQQTIIALLLIFALGSRSFARSAFCFLYGLVAVYVIKGAYSKSGSLSLGLWILLWPLLRKNAKAIAALVAGLVLASTYFAKEIMDSFGFVFHHELEALQGTAGRESTFAGRWQIWEEMAKEWQSLGTFAHTFGAGRMANGAHNDYLQVLFHGGYVGLGIYFILLASVGWLVGRCLWQKIDIWAITALFVFIMWMVDTIGLIPSAFSGYQWFAWGIIGFCLRYRQDQARVVQTQPLPVAPRRFANLLDAA